MAEWKFSYDFFLQQITKAEMICHVEVKTDVSSPDQFGSVISTWTLRLKGHVFVLVKGTYLSCRLDPWFRSGGV